MRILSLGTYPIVKPVHGGQRRTSQIGQYLELSGHTYQYACVYSPFAYGDNLVSEHDYPLSHVGGLYSETPFIEDLASGVFASSQDGPWNHFRSLVEQFQPDVLQVEQPFMWPLVKRLRTEGTASSTALVYSSHNVEAPLKRRILDGAGLSREKISRVGRLIEDLEEELIAVADVVIAVSQADAVHYRRSEPESNIVIVRNGTDRPVPPTPPPAAPEIVKGGHLFFVGSAYPPNVEGFEKFVLSNTLYGFPRKSLVVCGGAASAIRRSPLYTPHIASYDDRVEFFDKPEDSELVWLQDRARGTILPIATGGGSNLKTAEALSCGKWVVATPLALRSFEEFMGGAGVLVASTPEQFRGAMLDVIHAAPLVLNEAELTSRQALYWDRTLEDSGLSARLEALRVEKGQE